MEDSTIGVEVSTDIKKLDAFLEQEMAVELNDFVAGDISESEDVGQGYDSDSNLELENVTENKLQLDERNYFDLDFLNLSADISLVKHYLTPEEHSIINSCEDQKLKQLLLFNRAKNVYLKSIKRKTYELLKVSRDNLNQTREQLESEKVKKVSHRSMFSRLGFPYFKSKNKHFCPPNDDAIRKKANNEICTSYLVLHRRWSLEDQIILERSVRFYYLNMKIKECEHEIGHLYRLKKVTADEDQIAEIVRNISKHENHLEELKSPNYTIVPSLNCDDDIDWTQISNIDLRGRHYASTCRAMWNIYLHPDINKSRWTASEDTALLRLAVVNKNQNWERTAKELGTNRSSFMVCVHFHTTLCEKFSTDRFDADEDEKLRKVVDFCRIGQYIPWPKVALYFENRTRNQLYSRYTLNLVLTERKSGAFSAEEDILILILISKYGLDFSTIASHVPYRSRVQLSHRYNNYLKYDKMKQGYSLEDDIAIMDHVAEEGPLNWKKLSAKITGKNNSHLRLRYKYITAWLRKNPSKTVEDLPRKQMSYLETNGSLLRKVAESFDSTNTIPSIEEIKTRLECFNLRRTPRRYTFVNAKVDDELLEYFQGTHRLRTAKEITSANMTSIVNIVKSVLSVLAVTLVVPDKEVIDSNPALDFLDKEILSSIFDDVYHPREDELFYPSTSKTDPNVITDKVTKLQFTLTNSISLIPPNINSLIGMRSTLIKLNDYKTELKRVAHTRVYAKAKIPLQCNIREDIQKYDRSTQVIISMEQEKFKNRMMSIFKWPAIMSVFEPNPCLKLLGENNVRRVPLPTPSDVNMVIVGGPTEVEVVKEKSSKVGRPKKNLAKIELMNRRRAELKSQALAAKVTVNSSLPSEVVRCEPEQVEVADIDKLIKELKEKNPNAQIKILRKVSKPSSLKDKEGRNQINSGSNFHTNDNYKSKPLKVYQKNTKNKEMNSEEIIGLKKEKFELYEKEIKADLTNQDEIQTQLLLVDQNYKKDKETQLKEPSKSINDKRFQLNKELKQANSEDNCDVAIIKDPQAKECQTLKVREPNEYKRQSKEIIKTSKQEKVKLTKEEEMKLSTKSFNKLDETTQKYLSEEEYDVQTRASDVVTRNIKKDGVQNSETGNSSKKVLLLKKQVLKNLTESENNADKALEKELKFKKDIQSSLSVKVYQRTVRKPERTDNSGKIKLLTYEKEAKEMSSNLTNDSRNKAALIKTSTNVNSSQTELLKAYEEEENYNKRKRKRQVKNNGKAPYSEEYLKVGGMFPGKIVETYQREKKKIKIIESANEDMELKALKEELESDIAKVDEKFSRF